MTRTILERSPSDPVTSSCPPLFQQIVEESPNPQVVDPMNCQNVQLFFCTIRIVLKGQASDIKPANTTETVVEDLCLGRDQGGKGEK